MSAVIALLGFLRDTWREVFRVVGSLAGLTAVVATLQNEGVFSWAKQFVVEFIPIDLLVNLVTALYSWTDGLGDYLLQIIGGILLAFGLVGTFRSDRSTYTMPRTQAPATAWIGYAIMQPAGWLPVVNWSIGALLVAGVVLLFTSPQDREPIAQHFIVGVIELVISLVYIPWAIYLLINSPSTKSTSPRVQGDNTPKAEGEPPIRQ